MSPIRVLNQFTTTSKAWKELRTGKSFAEMSLANFNAKVEPSLKSRERGRSRAVGGDKARRDRTVRSTKPPPSPTLR